ncbi:hypothetical protein SCUCBS95973_003344 [Sporothrix curviconia]|uniref:Uncharacterized protein n=1 Tax=Sporothrix curviconia TaxID=1260050 RepID=A0ABP0BEJ1_9PEZI
MKASLILTVGLTWAGAAMGSRCKPSPVPSSSSSLSVSSSASSSASASVSSSSSLSASASSSSASSSSSSIGISSSVSSSASSSSASPSISSSASSSYSSSASSTSSSASHQASPSAPPSSCTGNILKNGAFASSLSSYWISIAASRKTNCYGPGVSCADLQPTSFSSGTADLTQTLVTTLGQKYQVTFDYKILSVSKTSPVLQVLKGTTPIQSIALSTKATNQWYHSDPVDFNGNFALTSVSFKVALGSAHGAAAHVDITNIVVSKCTK